MWSLLVEAVAGEALAGGAVVSGEALAGAGAGAITEEAAAGAMSGLLPSITDMIKKLTSFISTSLLTRIGSLSDSVRDATNAGIASFENLKSALTHFGDGLTSTLGAMWKVGSGPSASGNSANGLAILGGSGSAIQQVGGGAVSLFEGAGEGLGAMLGKGSDALSGIGQMVVDRIVSSVGLGGGILNLTIGPIIKGMIDTVFAPLKIVMNTLSSMVSVATAALGTLAETALKVLGIFGQALMAATEAALKMAHEIASIRNHTGRSLDESQQGYWNLRGAGMSGEEASGFLSSLGPAFIADMRARALGMPTATSPDAQARLAETFQIQQSQGVAGRIIAVAKLDAYSGGRAPDSLLQMVQQKPEIIRREQQWTQGVQKSLGVSPETIRRFADEFPLLINRISTFVETVKVRFATNLMPIVQGALNALTNYLASNADRIASAIQNSIEWLYVEAPHLILKGAEMMVNGFEAITNMFFGLVDAIPPVIRGIGQMASSIIDFIDPFLQAYDTLHDTDLSLKVSQAHNPSAFENAAHQVEKWSQKGRAGVGAMTTTARNQIKDWQKDQGTIAQRRADYQKQMLDALHQGNQINQAGHQNTANAVQNGACPDPASQLLTRIGGYVAANQYLTATR